MGHFCHIASSAHTVSVACHCAYRPWGPELRQCVQVPLFPHCTLDGSRSAAPQHCTPRVRCLQGCRDPRQSGLAPPSLLISMFTPAGCSTPHYNSGLLCTSGCGTSMPRLLAASCWRNPRCRRGLGFVWVLGACRSRKGCYSAVAARLTLGSC